MTLALEPVLGSSSPLGRFDPRWKLAALMPAAFVTALLQTVPAALAALLFAWVLVFLGRIPLCWYLRRMAGLVGFLALFVVWAPWLVPGDGWDIGPLRLSIAGLTIGLLIFLKALAIVTLMLVLWTTASMDCTLKAAHALHLPGLIVQLLVLTYRYIFLLGEELARLRIALRVRGFRNRPSLHSYRTVGHVAGALILRGYERAERVSQAMRCRGFDGRHRSLAEFRTRPADVVLFGLIIASAAGLCLLDSRL